MKNSELKPGEQYAVGDGWHDKVRARLEPVAAEVRARLELAYVVTPVETIDGSTLQVVAYERRYGKVARFQVMTLLDTDGMPLVSTGDPRDLSQAQRRLLRAMNTPKGEPYPATLIIGRHIEQPWSDYVDHQTTRHQKQVRDTARREVINELNNERSQAVHARLREIYADTIPEDHESKVRVEGRSPIVSRVSLSWDVAADLLGLDGNAAKDLDLEALVEERYATLIAEKGVAL